MNVEQRIERIEAALGLSSEPVSQGSVGIVDAFAVLTISRHVCREMEVDINDLVSQRRFPHVSRARFAICWIAKRNLQRSLTQIGRVLGIDHSSVIHAIRRAKQLADSDLAFGLAVALVEQRLFGAREQ